MLHPELPRLPDGRIFGEDTATVVFVLGGPGVGKGTQCTLAVPEFGLVHLSAGDLLRAERSRPGSKYVHIIDEYIREGLIIPQEITISLLMDAMQAICASPRGDTELPSGPRRFLIDGFPRHIPQAMLFEEKVCPAAAVIFYECDPGVMVSRVQARSRNSGRTDDNSLTIQKRLQTFRESTLPVRQHYALRGILHPIDCGGTVEEVYARTRDRLASIFVCP